MPRELPTINWHSQLLEEGLRQIKEKEMKPEKRRPCSNYGKGKGLSTGIRGDCLTPRMTCQVHCHSQLSLAAREATGVKWQHRLESSRGSSFHTCSSIHKKQSHGRSFSDKVSLDFPKYHNPPCLEHAEYVTKSSAKGSVNLRVAWKHNRRGNSESK